VRQLGIRSSLRTPVVIAGSSELVLSISWQSVISEPDPATLAVVRRYADQAGLALEQLERRRAEDEVAARADATRRLQEVTASLSQATTSVDISNTCLERALASVGAEAGFVVLVEADGSKVVELVASAGYDDGELAAWRASGLTTTCRLPVRSRPGSPCGRSRPTRCRHSRDYRKRARRDGSPCRSRRVEARAVRCTSRFGDPGS
jgi:hypothetical protein